MIAGEGGGAGTGGESTASTLSTPEPPPLPAEIQADNIAAAKGDVLEIALGNYVETCGPSAFDHYPDNYPRAAPTPCGNCG